MAQQKAAANAPQDVTGIDLGSGLAEGASATAAAACQDVHELATPSGMSTGIASVHQVCSVSTVQRSMFQLCSCGDDLGLEL